MFFLLYGCSLILLFLNLQEWFKKILLMCKRIFSLYVCNLMLYYTFIFSLVLNRQSSAPAGGSASSGSCWAGCGAGVRLPMDRAAGTLLHQVVAQQ